MTSPPTHGITIWLTGLSGAGKSTIARMAADLLRSAGFRSEILDGDEVRSSLWPELGFGQEDRCKNVRRIGRIARLLASHGVVVLVPVIAPYEDVRATVRAEHDQNLVPYVEAYVSTPLAVAAQRDTKGLYAAHARGEISGLTGVDAPYEPPLAPDVVLDAHKNDAAECTDTLARFILTRLGLGSGSIPSGH